MPCIDGCVFPYPSGFHSVSRCICELKKLGFTGMIACGLSHNSTPYHEFSVYPARYIGIQSQRELRKEIQTCSREGTLCFIRAGDNPFNRSLLTTTGVTALCDLHQAPKHAFDRVCAHTAAERKVAIDIRLAPLRELRGIARERVIRLYEEILLLHNRYDFPIIISSGARIPSEMRSPRAIEALLCEIGMEKDLIHSAFSAVPELVQRNGPVRII